MRKKEEFSEFFSDNSYIKEVVKGIGNKNYKSLVCQELECHLLDRIDYYKELGYNEKTATEKATEDMGDPEETSIPLNTLHSQKWYKQPFNIIVIVLLAIQLIFLIVSTGGPLSLKYKFSSHYIYKDFISSGIFIFNALTIYFGYKKRSKSVLISHTILCVSQAFFNPYRPMFYAIIKIMRSGFKGYIHSIFSYEMVTGSITATMNLLSMCVSVLFAGLVLVFVIALYRSERGQVNKKERAIYRRVLNISKTIVSIFVVCTLTVMSVCTAIAYTKRYEIIEINKTIRKEIAEYILKTDLEGKTIEQLTEEVEDFLDKSEYDCRSEISPDSYRELNVGGIQIVITDIESIFSESERDELMINYYGGVTNRAIPEIYNAYLCTKDKFNFVKGMTIEDFCESNIADKVRDISRHNMDQTAMINISMDDGDTMTLYFENDVCVQVESYYKMMSYYDNEEFVGQENNEDVIYENNGDSEVVKEQVNNVELEFD